MFIYLKSSSNNYPLKSLSQRNTEFRSKQRTNEAYYLFLPYFLAWKYSTGSTCLLMWEKATTKANSEDFAHNQKVLPWTPAENY